MKSVMQFCFYCNLVTEHKDEVCWLCVCRSMALEQRRAEQGADEEEDACPCKECREQRISNQEEK